MCTNDTAAELRLWGVLRNHKLVGFKFKRGVPNSTSDGGYDLP